MHRQKAYILEDEQHNRQHLLDLLHTHFPASIEVVAASGSIVETLGYLKHHAVDLLFLDIELADGSVFDLLQTIDHRRYKLIFITAYSEHAIRAIRFSAVDYLLKPIMEGELIVAVNKVLQGQVRENAVLNELVAMKRFELGEYLIVNNLHSIEKIPMESISYLKASGVYTAIYHDHKCTVSSKPIGIYEEVLPAGMFNRCHKSFIVNKHYIKKVVKGRSMLLRLHDGTELPVAVRKKEEFSLWFMN